jgi:DNA integrity scanning protein DisA with diadenylate cyclase activity
MSIIVLDNLSKIIAVKQQSLEDVSACMKVIVKYCISSLKSHVMLCSATYLVCNKMSYITTYLVQKLVNAFGIIEILFQTKFFENEDIK